MSIDGGIATSSSGIEMRTQALLPMEMPPKRLFTVAGFGIRDQVGPVTLSALRKVERTGSAQCAMDMGAWILAAAGVLDGHKATVHWEELGEFAEAFPDVIVTDNRFVMDGNRISAGGATASLEMMISLIRADYGSALAFDVTNMFVHDAEVIQRSERSTFHISRPHQPPQLVRSIDLMRANIEEPIPLDVIARTASCSARTLTRLFLRELALPPGKYYTSIRLLVARRLARETKISCADIAARTGFSSSAALARAYSSHFGSTISALRAR